MYIELVIAFKDFLQRWNQLESIVKLSTPIAQGLNTNDDLDELSHFINDLKFRAEVRITHIDVIFKKINACF